MSRVLVLPLIALLLFTACSDDEPAATPEQTAVLERVTSYDAWLATEVLPTRDAIEEVTGERPELHFGGWRLSDRVFAASYLGEEGRLNAATQDNWVYGAASFVVRAFATEAEAEDWDVFERPPDAVDLNGGAWLGMSAGGHLTGGFARATMHFRTWGYEDEGQMRALTEALRERAEHVLADAPPVPPDFPRDLAPARERLALLRDLTERRDDPGAAKLEVIGEAARQCDAWHAEGGGNWRLLVGPCLDFPLSVVGKEALLVSINYTLAAVDEAIALVQ
ncbi:MAG: hypothetical protein M0R73_10060 [Dehalococcoidia bacterium]|nr:hypothetical protein [Dehalococcoidia bacterium]